MTGSPSMQYPLAQTGQELDIAIVGDGYLQLTAANANAGSYCYTRMGHLSVNKNGHLGMKLRDGQEYDLAGPIVIPRGAEKFRIAIDGNIELKLPGFIRPRTPGQIHLARFTNPGAMSRIDEGIFVAGDKSGPPEYFFAAEWGRARIWQGFLESSTIDTK